MKLFTIETGTFKIDGGAMFGVVPKSLWQKVYPADENNMCTCALRSLLVDTGDRIILFDAGMGNKQDAKFFGRYNAVPDNSLEESLNSLGYSYDDITDVVLSHLHFDHCGGCVSFNDKKELEITFKNAWYWCSKQQWDCATNPNSREKASFLDENLLPIEQSGRLKLIEKDSEIIPGIFAQLHFGHTEGMIISLIRGKNNTLIYLGDLMPAVAHIPLPYISAYDTKPLDVLEEKEKLLKEAANKKHILFFEHDYYYECARVAETEKGIRASNTFKLSEIQEEF
ncbi:MAG: MBL fold metallo-hydrolase [Bacteroidetes bacterium RIFOXYA12_FULL_35_11]|nr:MAG: MBL fold metallo-hydrolase [Bacteroidetes bacterium GWF2_35_48]OFY80180.1 MAG: MBL fold metallo-hydrolase [Bacteroidetes bacterium RIFOXYA12_FULL_35_11]OFY93520.1 MAG: MBL fold metallo-hydrolase [Bacteroidetes bacterium RIFOXYC12_FULL_35_7]HBX51741.1 MBL fold metallo-hydrolase [Bacteroidales bacterium]